MNKSLILVSVVGAVILLSGCGLQQTKQSASTKQPKATTSANVSVKGTSHASIEGKSSVSGSRLHSEKNKKPVTHQNAISESQSKPKEQEQQVKPQKAVQKVNVQSPKTLTQTHTTTQLKQTQSISKSATETVTKPENNKVQPVPSTQDSKPNKSSSNGNNVTINYHFSNGTTKTIILHNPTNTEISEQQQELEKQNLQIQNQMIQQQIQKLVKGASNYSQSTVTN